MYATVNFIAVTKYIFCDHFCSWRKPESTMYP